MESSDSDKNLDVTMSDLVVALNDMRDALVKVSLELHEYQFHFDIARRGSAAEQSTDLLKKLKS